MSEQPKVTAPIVKELIESDDTLQGFAPGSTLNMSSIYSLDDVPILAKDLDVIAKNREKDFAWILENRDRMVSFVITLLVVQILLIAVLIWYLYATNKAEKNVTILSLLISGTIIESYFLIRQIFRLLFNPLSFSALDEKHKSKN